MDNEIKLWRKNQLGIGSWRIWYELHDEGDATLHYAHATSMGGSEVSHQDHITRNMSGRSILEQVQLEMKSRISRQLDKGYKPSIDEAKLGITNQMGFMNPMLAQPLDRVGTPASFKNAYIQRKYDGHRCLITNFDSEVLPYTRKGKPIDTISHILNEVARILPEGVTMDGELYIHGLPLQNIGSIIKRVQADNIKLGFHWYDVFSKSSPLLTYAKRYELMCQMAEGFEGMFKHFAIVPTYPVASMEEAMTYFRQFRADSYEGAILRLDTKPYQDSVRSSSLIKLKEWHDCEVTALSARPSKEGWAILTCRMDSGKIFDTSAPGSIPDKEEVLRNFDAKYKNKRLTIEYASLTNDGLPFHASALRWHEAL